MVKSRVDLINRYNPTKVIEFEYKKDKYRKETVPRFFCMVGDELIFISKTPYVHKEGWLCIVENKNGERFLIDKESLDFSQEDKPFNLDDYI